MSARALYDYTGRDHRELSFKRGDIVEVIKKTPDGHWWDGLCGNKRGFIPVAYVEIAEFQPTSLLPPPPPPPSRRASGMQWKCIHNSLALKCKPLVPELNGKLNRIFLFFVWNACVSFLGYAMTGSNVIFM